MKQAVLLLLLLPLFYTAAAQQLAGSSAASTHKVPSTSSDNAGSTADAPLLDVLFATNDDGDLYVNNNFKGAVSKTAYRYIKMTAGSYTYRLKSKATGDEYKGTFEVKEGGLNEVFIDLLYAIDQGRRLRDSIISAAATQRQAPVVPVSPPVTQSRTPINESNPPIAAQTPATEPSTDKWKYVQIASINAMEAAMVPVTGGAFVMGNNRAPSADEAEHNVSVSPFLFSKYEVTQRQWELIMGFNPSEHKGCPTCPVENVSWEDAVKFIQKINSLGNKKFRLPTEAEWEYVARTGGRPEIDRAGGEEQFIKNVAWYFGNADKKTHPVGDKNPTAAGVYDLFGNVAEWCSDWYDASYFRDESLQNNPQGPPLGKEKVVRGGSFADYTGDRFRPSLRTKQKPTFKGNNIGFRLVMDR